MDEIVIHKNIIYENNTFDCERNFACLFNKEFYDLFKQSTFPVISNNVRKNKSYKQNLPSYFIRRSERGQLIKQNVQRHDHSKTAML